MLKNDLEKCNSMIVVIGPRWLELLKSSRPSDGETSQDYVHLEVASALERKLPVFPVLVDGAAMPEARITRRFEPLAFSKRFPFDTTVFHVTCWGWSKSFDARIDASDLEGGRNFRTIHYIVRRDFLLFLAASAYVGNDILSGRKFRVLW